MTVDITELAGILRDAARSEIVPRFRRLDSSAVRQKTEAIDLVTEADENAERVIREFRLNRPGPTTLATALFP